MTEDRTFRAPSIITMILIATILVSTLVIVPPLNHSSATIIPSPIRQPPFAGNDELGIDCGYGSNQAVMNATGYPGPDGTIGTGNAGNPTLDSSCTWAGSADRSLGGGAQLQPLVSDNPTFTSGPSCCAAPSRGGGFTAEIVFIQNSSTFMNGYDITVSWNPNVLSAVEFDQTGLPFFLGTSAGVPTIDNVRGTAELAQVLVSPPAPAATVGGNVTIFRMRFDVVGLGTTSLTISGDKIYGLWNGSSSLQLKHSTSQGSFTSSNIPDTISGKVLGYSVTWTFAPSPEVPGAPLTLTATASCTGCATALTYKWDVDSVQGYPDPSASPPTIEAIGSVATITAPSATLVAHRVTLIVNDTAGDVAEATRRLPLTNPVVVHSPTTFTVGTPGSLTAQWLGGIPPYTGTTGAVGVRWTLCKNTGTTQLICSNPNPSISTTSLQTNTILETYKFGGVFTGNVKITDTGESQIFGSPTTTIATFQVNVTGNPQAYIVGISTNATTGAFAGQTVQFNATVIYNPGYAGSGLHGTRFNYTLIFGDGTKTSLVSGLATSATHTFTSIGTYSVTVVVQDVTVNALFPVGETGFTSLSVYSPLTGSFSYTPSSPSTGQTITFTPSGSGGASPYTYSWNFGDGTTATGTTATHSYAIGGTFTVKLNVTDSQGHIFTSTQSVVVTGGSSGTANLYLEVGGIAVAVIAAVILGLLIIRKRRKTTPISGAASGSPTR